MTDTTVAQGTNIDKEHNENMTEVKNTRRDLHLPRRFFHLFMGLSAGLIYKHYLTHQQAVHILGMATCLFYIQEQIRLKYPEFKSIFSKINNYLLRAEEQLKESATIPYLMGMLLTILTFPKYMTLVAVFTLAISDPLSAVMGILFGKTKLKEHRSLEGSSSFFVSTFLIHLFVLVDIYPDQTFKLFIVSFLSSAIVTGFDFLELKIDDNFTIPIVTATSLWIITAII